MLSPIGGVCCFIWCVVRPLWCGAGVILQACIVNKAENSPFPLLGIWLGFTGWFTFGGVSGRTSLLSGFLGDPRR